MYKLIYSLTHNVTCIQNSPSDHHHVLTRWTLYSRSTITEESSFCACSEKSGASSQNQQCQTNRLQHTPGIHDLRSYLRDLDVLLKDIATLTVILWWTQWDGCILSVTAVQWWVPAFNTSRYRLITKISCSTISYLLLHSSTYT